MTHKPYLFTCPGICWVVGAAFGLLIALLFGQGFFTGLILTLVVGAASALFFQWAFCRGLAQGTGTQPAQAAPLPKATVAPVQAAAAKQDAVIAEPVKAMPAPAPAPAPAPVQTAPAAAPVAKAAPKPAAKAAPAAKAKAKAAPKAVAKSASAAKATAPKPKAEPKARPVAADGKPELLKAARGGKADNLKEIKGIGPKLEAMLHKMGVFHFDQIASWRAAEVDWADTNIEGFKGRVTRDDWVAQAKTLAAGGATEFSARVGKGGVY